jgi:hypothetical protein
MAALAERVWRHPEPPEPRDAAAYTELCRLVHEAAAALDDLDASPAVVASAPNRFNDVGWYDWLLVRVGECVVEHDAYTTTRAAYTRDLASAAPDVRAAAAALERLETAGWHTVFLRAFDLPLDDQFLAVVIQHGLPWFVYASSNCSGREHAFALWRDDALSYFGECITRTDDELIDGRGLVLHTVDAI